MSDEWKEALPEELRERPMVKNAKSLEEFVNNGLGLESKMGQSLSMPTDEWTDGEREQWRDKVKKYDPNLSTIDDKVDVLKKWGMPDDATGYQPDPDREYNLSEEQIQAIKENAFSTALTQEQFYHQLNTADDQIKQVGEQTSAAIQADRQDMFDIWGADKANQLDNIDSYLALMDAPDSIKESVRSTMTKADLAFYARAAGSVKGESLVAARDKTAAKQTVTPIEAAEKIKVIMADPAFRNKLDPNHAAINKRYLQMINMKAGRPPNEGLQ